MKTHDNYLFLSAEAPDEGGIFLTTLEYDAAANSVSENYSGN